MTTQETFVEHAVLSLIYTVHIFILDYTQAVCLSGIRSVFLASEKMQFIYSRVKGLMHYTTGVIT